VWVHRYWAIRAFVEGNFWGLYGVLRTELELQSVDLVQVDRIDVQNLQIKEPLIEAVGRNERYSWR